MLDVAVDESDLLRELREETTASVEFAVMQISPEQGQFMTLLMRLIAARRVIELGTYTGYSSICIAAGLPDDGELICCDITEQWTDVAQKYWRRAGLENRITLQLRPALETLQALLDEGRAGEFDFMFIDADKQNYLAYYELALELLRDGGLIAIDNTLWSGAVVDDENQEPGTRAIRRMNEFLKQDSRVHKCMLPIGDGLSLAMKRA
jgi:predicted O-methyltransferase YrrM